MYFASLPRTSRNKRITSVISPPQEYVLTQGELQPEDVGPQGVPGLLDAFERSVLRTPDSSISLARLKGDKEDKNSFLIVYRATAGINFLGWLNVYETGMAVQWKVKAAEVRAVRSPDAGNSHFNYSHDHEKGLYNAVFKRKDGDNGLGTVWDLATGNVMTDGTAKKATWFKGYLMQRFNDALTDDVRPTAGHSQQQAASPASQGGTQPSMHTSPTNSAPTVQTLTNTGPQEQPDRRD